MKITTEAFAKINFNLHVLPKTLPNGYHEVKLLNFQASLSDKIILQELDQGIKLICDNPELPTDEANLAYKAAKIVIEKYYPKGGIKIILEKNIPVTSGLGGGSADGAAVINGLNKLWKLKLTDQQKIDLWTGLGVDVCYCVIGGVCVLSGAGEIVEPIKETFSNINLIIVTPSNTSKPSSGWAFSKLDLNKVGQYLEKLDKLIEAIKNKDLHGVAKNLHNDFEEPMFKHFPEVKEIKDKILENGALGTNLCGAGLSVFGIFETEKSAKIAFENLKKIYPQTYLCQTI